MGRLPIDLIIRVFYHAKYGRHVDVYLFFIQKTHEDLSQHDVRKSWHYFVKVSKSIL